MKPTGPGAGGEAGRARLEEQLDRDHRAARSLWLAHLRGDPGAERTSLTRRQWGLLADEALRHELGELTYRLLADGPLASEVPPEIRERLHARYTASAFRNAIILRRTRDIAAALSGAGIPLIALKGVHLARFLYAEPALRSMADVDLLVPRERLQEADRVLLGLGFGPTPRPDVEESSAWSHHLPKLVQEGWPVVELHWHIELPSSPLRIDLAGLWGRSRPAILDGVPIRVLAPEDLLLHLVVHASHHHAFDRAPLKALVDIATVIGRQQAELDWSGFTERANAWLVSGFVYAALRLAEEILATPVPAEVFDRLPHDPADEAVVAVARRYVLAASPGLAGAYLELAKTPGLRERWTQAVRHVFLPRDAMERIYGPHSGAAARYFSYARRIVDLLARRSRLVLNVLFRTRSTHSALAREDSRQAIERWVRLRTPGPPANRSLLEGKGPLQRES